MQHIVPPKLDKNQESLQISCNGKADGDKEQKDALSQLEIFLSLANIAASFIDIEQVEGKNRQQGQGEGGVLPGFGKILSQNSNCRPGHPAAGAQVAGQCPEKAGQTVAGQVVADQQC